MATYSTIKGFTIQSLATDPYISLLAAGTWASKGNLNQARTELAGAGTQTAALAFGGQVPPYSKLTESYDGTTWTAVNDIQTARRMLGGAGTQAAALAFTGRDPGNNYSNYSEEYNGTSWAEGSNTPGTTSEMRGCGTQTAAVGVGGYNGSAQTICYEYDGTSWSNGGSIGTARYASGVAGTQTAAIDASGAPAYSGETEIYDGTTWTSLGLILNTGRQGAGVGGTSTATLIAAGEAPPEGGLQSGTEAFDGTTWTTLPATVANARFNCGSAIGATQATTTIFGGAPGPFSATEEFSVPSGAISLAQEGQVWYNTTSTVLKGFGAQGTGAWASGDNLNTPRGNNMGMTTGIATAALTFGGHETTLKDATETYNGTSWTETGHAMNTARYNGGSQGTQTATVCFGGGTPGSVTNVELYNGSTWTDSTAMPTASYGLAPAGSSSIAALAISGVNPPSTHVTEAFELTGTSWTEIASVTTGRQSGSAAGTVTAALFVCGSTGAPLYARDLVESYNGTAWSTSTATPADRYGIPSFGSQSACMTAGGAGPPGAKLATTLFWNGSSWTELADLATARYSNATARGGTSTSGLYVGSATSPYQATEEWSVPNATKTFTAS